MLEVARLSGLTDNRAQNNSRGREPVNVRATMEAVFIDATEWKFRKNKLQESLGNCSREVDCNGEFADYVYGRSTAGNCATFDTSRSESAHLAKAIATTKSMDTLVHCM